MFGSSIPEMILLLFKVLLNLKPEEACSATAA